MEIPARKTVKTRLCMISDTHNQPPRSESSPYAYRRPLPAADVLLHAGDLTMTGRIEEYLEIFDVLAEADAKLKIVIAGNHDITLDEDFYKEIGQTMFHRNRPENMCKVKDLWTGERAKQAGIVYLEEGTRRFHLTNGAELTIYTSPWQPEFYTWAFNYPRDIDRFNPSPAVAKFKASNPIPSWPQIDVMLTHGPPYGILDVTEYNQVVGCEHLRRAVARCRPRLHCFGHIHEGWGGEKLNWSNKRSERFNIDSAELIEQRSAFVDLSESGKSPLKFGEETFFVNAAIMDVTYRARNAPWVVDLDLPCAMNKMNTEIMEDVYNFMALPNAAGSLHA